MFVELIILYYNLRIYFFVQIKMNIEYHFIIKHSSMSIKKLQ